MRRAELVTGDDVVSAIDWDRKSEIFEPAKEQRRLRYDPNGPSLEEQLRESQRLHGHPSLRESKPESEEK